MRSPYRPLHFLRDAFKRSITYPCSRSLDERKWPAYLYLFKEIWMYRLFQTTKNLILNVVNSLDELYYSSSFHPNVIFTFPFSIINIIYIFFLRSTLDKYLFSVDIVCNRMVNVKEFFKLQRITFKIILSLWVNCITSRNSIL